MNNGQAPIDRQKLLMKRMRAGLSRRELATLAQLDPSFIRLLETGNRGPSPQTLGALARALGCDITELMPDEMAGLMSAMPGETPSASARTVRPDALCAQCDMPWSPEHACKGAEAA